VVAQYIKVKRGPTDAEGYPRRHRIETRRFFERFRTVIGGRPIDNAPAGALAHRCSSLFMAPKGSDSTAKHAISYFIVSPQTEGCAT
jgi:hypothetical protein